MAPEAILGKGCVVVVHMALAARDRVVRTGQREDCTVIERRRAPATGRMAKRAIGWITGRCVRRIRGAVEVCLMTSEAIRGRRNVIIVGVALRAGYRGMHARQWVVRIDGVIKLGIRPVGGRMARPAISGKSQLQVGRIVGVRKIRAMAGIALRRSSFVDVIQMTRHAGKRRMRPRQRISRVRQVVELGAKPRVHRVAALARRRELEAHVIDHGS